LEDNSGMRARLVGGCKTATIYCHRLCKIFLSFNCGGMFNSHDKHLSFCEFIQIFHDAPEGTERSQQGQKFSFESV
jgi:hypothetical protein